MAHKTGQTKLEPHQYTTVPPQGCPFQVGDTVTFTNEYDVSFPGLKIYGFALQEDWLHGSHGLPGAMFLVSCEGTGYIYLEKESYWFPNSIGSLKLEHRNEK